MTEGAGPSPDTRYPIPGVTIGDGAIIAPSLGAVTRDVRALCAGDIDALENAT